MLWANQGRKLRLGRIVKVELEVEGEGKDTNHRVTTRRKNYGSKWRDQTCNLMKLIVRRRRRRRN